METDIAATVSAAQPRVHFLGRAIELDTARPLATDLIPTAVDPRLTIALNDTSPTVRANSARLDVTANRAVLTLGEPT